MAIAMAIVVTCCGIALPAFAQDGSKAVPAAPSDLWWDDRGQTDLIVRWSDNSNNEDNFHISKEDPNYSDQWDRIGTVDANVTGFRVSGLTAGTLYRFRVRAQNASGYSAHSEILSVTTLPPTPSAPSSLTATNITFTTVSLSWQDNSSNESTFQIQHRNNRVDPDTWITRGSVLENITNYTDTSLSPNTSYSFRVRARNAGGDSPWSNVINLGTPQNPPAAPSGLIASQITQTGLRLDWTDNASNEDDFRVYRLDQGEPDLPENWNEIGAPNSDITFWDVTGLSPATQYWFKVRARNGGGYSAYSGTVGITTLPLPPSAPSLLAATEITFTTVSLSWQDNSNNEATFQIQHRNNRVDPDTWIDRGAVGANITNFTDTSLSPNTSYSFRVRAHNSGGNSAWSNVINLGTPQNPPAAPTELTASQITQTGLRLTWIDNARNEDDFRVYRLDDGEPDIPENWNEIGSPNSNPDQGSTLFMVTGLSPGTRYWFKVRARNGGGYSAYTNTVTARTDGPPEAPSALSADNITVTSIVLHWQDNSSDEDAFYVSRLDPGEDPANPAHWDRVAETGPGATSVYLPNLRQLTRYLFRVRAHNSYGNSAHSDTLGVQTLAVLPHFEMAAAISPAVGLRPSAAWGDYDSDGDEDLYVVRSWDANGLYRNNGDGTFSDVSAAPINVNGPGTCAAWGDIDRDGDLDLYVASNGETNRLFRNNGAGGFAEVVGTPLAVNADTRDILWTDFDNNGSLDLLLVRGDGANMLFRNDGGVFTQVACAALVIPGASVSAATTDYDLDGDADIYVVNRLSGGVAPNRLLRNDGNFTFTDVGGTPLGIAAECRSAIWGDYDLDGRPDLYVVTHGQGNRLFANEAGGFIERTDAATGSSGPYVGASWIDFDRDGDLDLYVMSDEATADNRLLRNDGVFVEVTDAVISSSDAGFAAALADYDGDGRPDLYFAAQVTGQSSFGLVQNLVEEDYHWLAVSLRGVESNTFGIGGKVSVFGDGVCVAHHEIGGGSRPAVQSSLVATCGLGACARIDSLVVVWPGGHRQVMLDTAIDTHLVVREQRDAGQIAFDFDVASAGATQPHPGAPGQGGWYTDPEASAGGEMQGAVSVSGLALHERAAAAAGYGARTGDAIDASIDLSDGRHVILAADFLARTSSLTTTNRYQATLSVSGGSDPVYPIVDFAIVGGGVVSRGVGGCSVALSRFNGVDGNELVTPFGAPALSWDSWHHVEIAIDLVRGAYSYIDVDGQRSYLWGMMLPRGAAGAQWLRGDMIDRVTTGIVSLPGSKLGPTDDDIYWDNIALRIVSSVAGADEYPAADKFTLMIAPNPFNAATSLHFTMNDEADVSARIYDVRGRLVRDLRPGRLRAGHHRVDWDGRDDRGAAVAAGVYLARVVVDGGVVPANGRLVLVK